MTITQRRSLRLLVAGAALTAAVLLPAQLAAAEVRTGPGLFAGFAQNTVWCDASQHTASITVLMKGTADEETAVERATYAMVYVWSANSQQWANSEWVLADDQFTLNLQGSSDTLYAYFFYAFQEANGSYSILGGWAGDGSGYGTYAGPRPGASPSCVI